MRRRLLLSGVVGIAAIAFLLLRHGGPSIKQSSNELEKQNLSEVHNRNRSPNSDLKQKAQESEPKKPSKIWSVAIPDTDVNANKREKPDYKRVFGIVERTVPPDLIAKEKLNPTNTKGLDKIKETIGLTGSATHLKVNKSFPAEANGLVTTRLKVSTNGIPVFGSEVIINQKPTSNGLKEEVVRDIINEFPKNLPTQPQISVERALESSTMDAQNTAQKTDLTVKLLSSHLVYFPSTKTLNLAWKITVQTSSEESEGNQDPFGRWSYFVDAISGEVLSKANSVQTETPVPVVYQGSGNGGNDLVDRPWNQELDVILDSTSNQYQMNTSRLVTIDLRSTNPPTSWGQIKFWSYLLSDGYQLSSSSDLNNFSIRSVNNAHGYAENTLDMLSYFGYNSIDEKGLKLPSLVNYNRTPSYYNDNAFWDGRQMVYGIGNTDFLNLAADIGVVAHEIDHGFTQYHSDLYYGSGTESMGLNESFSDIAGVTAKFFINQAGADFRIGERIINSSGSYATRGFLREMCNPKGDNITYRSGTVEGSIDNYADYKAGIDGHYSSGIMNKAFCRFSKRLSSSGDPGGTATRDGVLRAATVFFDANKTKWGSLSPFKVAAMGTMKSAQNLGYSASEIQYLKDSWSDVGIDATPRSVTITVDSLFPSVEINPWGSLDARYWRWSCNSDHTTCSIVVDEGYPFKFRLGSQYSNIATVSGCDSITLNNSGYPYGDRICNVLANSDKVITPSYICNENLAGRNLVNGVCQICTPDSRVGSENCPSETVGTRDVFCSHNGYSNVPIGVFIYRNNSPPDQAYYSECKCPSGYRHIMLPGQDTCYKQDCTPDSVLNRLDCSLANGTGSQSLLCNAEGSASSWTACTATSCNSGYYISNDGACVQDCTAKQTSSQTCSITNGTGTQTRGCLSDGHWGAFGACKFSSCNSGYYLSGGVCKQDCAAGQTGSQTCSISHGTGSKSRACLADGHWDKFGSCTATSCNSGYYLSGGACNPQVCTPGSSGTQTCSVPNGSGTQTGTCNSDGSAYENWGTCTTTSCNTGYMLIGGVCSIPGPTDPAQVEPGQTQGTTPIGYFDGRGSAQGDFNGWVCQRNLRNSLYINVYVGISLNNKRFVGQYVANHAENVGVSNACSFASKPYRGSRRFSIPNSVFTSADRGSNVYIFGVQYGSTSETQIPFGGLPGYSNKVN